MPGRAPAPVLLVLCVCASWGAADAQDDGGGPPFMMFIIIAPVVLLVPGVIFIARYMSRQNRGETVIQPGPTVLVSLPPGKLGTASKCTQGLRLPTPCALRPPTSGWHAGMLLASLHASGCFATQTAIQTEPALRWRCCLCGGNRYINGHRVCDPGAWHHRATQHAAGYEQGRADIPKSKTSS